MKSVVTAAAAWLLLVSAAQAHFVWLAVEKDASGQNVAKVYFSELAEPDKHEMLDKVTKVKVWTRAADGQTSKPLELKKEVDGDVGALTAEVPAGTSSLSGTIDYGVLDRRGEVFALNYHAKYLEAGSKTAPTEAADKQLPLDVSPVAADQPGKLVVSLKGKPTADLAVVILDPAGNESEMKTDENGQVNFDASKPGLYSIRAKYVDNTAGKSSDKEFSKTNHYCTLTLRVPPAAATIGK